MAVRISYAQIKQVVCQHHGLRLVDLYAESRKRSLVRPRQMCFLLAKELTDLSYTRIGELTGRRDHATVIHGKTKAEELRISDDDFRASYDKVFADLHTLVNEAADD